MRGPLSFLPYIGKLCWTFGRVAERLIASVSKTDSPSRVTGVQIPPLPNFAKGSI